MKLGMRALLGWALMGGGIMQAMAEAPAAPAPAAVQLDRELAAVVNDAQHPLSGLSVLAIRDGKVAYQQQFGLRRIDTAGTGVTAPVTAATMFRIASISKMMTTFGLMKLVEEGKLDLDADVSTYLGFPLRNPNAPGSAITLRHLLSHTSTLRDDAGYSWGTDTKLADVLQPGGGKYGAGAMWAQGKNAAPGAYFTYCNLNWGVIGTIMERVSGERFDRLMKRLLLAPMGLRGGYNTSEFSPAEVADTATLYRKRTTDTEIWNPAGPWIAQVDNYGVVPPAAPAGIASYVIGSNATLFSPTGGMRISAPDMGKIMLMLINGGQHEGKQVLKPETIKLMFSEQWTYKESGGGNGDTLRGLYHSWGLGAQRFADTPGAGNRLVQGGGFSAVGHLGEAYGLVSTFAVDLDGRNGLVSLIGGFGTDPEQYPGRYSALVRSEELILTALYRRAVLGKTD
ncbi:serine hydrolase domain-containing protein [Pseudoduganella aquatica]|uniref:serine hydrolase domain-containing protein n=1 Tax=Pseudoduganella aquatica TaxID=2660641 RepID=UPI001E310E91|nr:serine hydrolase [Pseudoduganella aquatica]